MEENLNKINVSFLNENGQSFFEPETASAEEIQIEKDAKRAGINLHEITQNEVFDFESAFGAQQEKWQAKVRTFEQGDRGEFKQNAMLLDQIKRNEEKISSLNRQFIELFDYSESVYRYAEARRKEAEVKSKEAQTKSKEAREQVEQLRNIVAQKNAELSYATKDVQSAEEKVKFIAQDNAHMNATVLDLKAQLEKKNSEDVNAQSSLAQGRQLIDSAVRSMTDFQESFQSYLKAVEKDGITPITVRAAKIFAEHWRIQGEDMSQISRVLVEMTRAR